MGLNKRKKRAGVSVTNTLLAYEGGGVVSLSDTRGQTEPQQRLVRGPVRRQEIHSSLES